jgi:hypothetical protein
MAAQLTPSAPPEPMMDVKAHFTCKGKVKKLKYWYGDSLLVGVLGQKRNGDLGVKDTYSLIYPEIYGAIVENEHDNKRSSASEKQSLRSKENLKRPQAKNH